MAPLPCGLSTCVISFPSSYRFFKYLSFRNLHFNYIMVRKHVLYDFRSFKLITVCYNRRWLTSWTFRVPLRTIHAKAAALGTELPPCLRGAAAGSVLLFLVLVLVHRLPASSPVTDKGVFMSASMLTDSSLFSDRSGCSPCILYT